jgi:hypothetical protein
LNIENKMQYLWPSMGLEKNFMVRTFVAYDVANIMYDSVKLIEDFFYEIIPPIVLYDNNFCIINFEGL